MDIFKNKVGRPSNETIKKRRIVKLIIIIVVVLLVCLCGYKINELVSKRANKQEIIDTGVENVNIGEAEDLINSTFYEFKSIMAIYGMDYLNSDDYKTISLINSLMGDSLEGEFKYDELNLLFNERYINGSLLQNDIEYACGKIDYNSVDNTYKATKNSECSDSGLAYPVVFNAKKTNDIINVEVVYSPYIDDTNNIELSDGTFLDVADYNNNFDEIAVTYGKQMKKYNLEFQIVSDDLIKFNESKEAE